MCFYHNITEVQHWNKNKSLVASGNTKIDFCHWNTYIMPPSLVNTHINMCCISLFSEWSLHLETECMNKLNDFYKHIAIPTPSETI